MFKAVTVDVNVKRFLYMCGTFQYDIFHFMGSSTNCGPEGILECQCHCQISIMKHLLCAYFNV